MKQSKALILLKEQKVMGAKTLEGGYLANREPQNPKPIEYQYVSAGYASYLVERERIENLKRDWFHIDL